MMDSPHTSAEPSGGSSPSAFVHHELDEVSLTYEEYVELRFGYADGPVLEHVTDFESFKFHSSSSSRESDTGSSSCNCYSDVCIKCHGDGRRETNTGNNLQRPELNLRPRIFSTISMLSGIPASSWNRFPQSVYRSFKVHPYIVEPNYFLSTSSSTTETLESQKLSRHLTMDEIFARMASNKFFEQWSDIEPYVDELLYAYDGIEHLPSIMTEQKQAEDLIKIYQDKLEGLRGYNPRSSSYKQNFTMLSEFSKSLGKAIAEQHFLENLSEEYIQILLEFFQEIQKFPVRFRKKSVTLNLYERKTKQGHVMTICPDVIMVYDKYYLLVGEIKPHRLPKKDRKLCTESDEKAEYVPHGTDNTAHSEMVQTEGELEDQSHGAQHAKRRKLSEEEEILCASQKMGDESSSVQCKVDMNNAEGTSKPADALAGSSSETSSATNKNNNYRHLKMVEKLKVSRFLPQLVAEMLACIDKNKHCALGRGNEKVQLGFAVDGFKLRFVRLVLRNSDDSTDSPSISNIRNPDVKCDVFLTKEFNLFNKRHLKMFFQMLFAFILAYQYFD